MRLLALLLLAALVAACSLFGPPVTCFESADLSPADCDRAADVAAEALPAGHPSFNRVEIHRGCPPHLHCLPTTVEISLTAIFYQEAGSEYYVWVNRADWSALFRPTPSPAPAI